MKETMMKRIFWLMLLLGALGLMACTAEPAVDALPESMTANETVETNPPPLITTEPDPIASEETTEPEGVPPMPGDLDPALIEEYKSIIKQLVFQVEPSDHDIYGGHYLRATLQNPTSHKIESYVAFLQFPESDEVKSFYLLQTVLEGQTSPNFYGEGPLDGNYADYEVTLLMVGIFDDGRLISLDYDPKTDTLEPFIHPDVEGPPFDVQSMIPSLELQDLYGNGEYFLTGTFTNTTEFTIDAYLVEYLDKASNEIGQMFPYDPIEPGATISDLISYDNAVTDIDQVEILRILAQMPTDNGVFSFQYDTRLDWARFTHIRNN